jgi:hypothetical protein
VPRPKPGARLVIDRLAQGTIVAVNLAFEVAAASGEVLLVDDDACGGAVAHVNIQDYCPKGRLGPERPAPHDPLSLSRPSRADVAAWSPEFVAAFYDRLDGTVPAACGSEPDLLARRRQLAVDHAHGGRRQALPRHPNNVQRSTPMRIDQLEDLLVRGL